MYKRKVKELLKELEERIEKVQSSEEFKEYLQFFSRFHDYSYRNILLIKMQKPDAKLVAGYKQWQEKFNRYVKKGEEGIMILAPYKYKKKVIEIEESIVDGEVIKKEVEEEKQFVNFRPVYVFDISQTEGKKVPTWKIEFKETEKKLLEPLIKYANKEGIKIELKKLRNGLNGYSKGGKVVINNRLNLTERIAVLVHELAHEKLHYLSSYDKELTKEIVELEAEAVSFVVMNHFDIEILSDKYLALYKRRYNLMESFKGIYKISNTIIKTIL